MAQPRSGADAYRPGHGELPLDRLDRVGVPVVGVGDVHKWPSTSSPISMRWWPTILPFPITQRSPIVMTGPLSPLGDTPAESVAVRTDDAPVSEASIDDSPNNAPKGSRSRSVGRNARSAARAGDRDGSSRRRPPTTSPACTTSLSRRRTRSRGPRGSDTEGTARRVPTPKPRPTLIATAQRHRIGLVRVQHHDGEAAGTVLDPVADRGLSPRPRPQRTAERHLTEPTYHVAGWSAIAEPSTSN